MRYRDILKNNTKAYRLKKQSNTLKLNDKLERSQVRPTLQKMNRALKSSSSPSCTVEQLATGTAAAFAAVAAAYFAAPYAHRWAVRHGWLKDSVAEQEERERIIEEGNLHHLAMCIASAQEMDPQEVLDILVAEELAKRKKMT